MKRNQDMPPSLRIEAVANGYSLYVGDRVDFTSCDVRNVTYVFNTLADLYEWIGLHFTEGRQ